tara:strand:- start:10272 stop:11018 length:747 start_codon:yes stop_codon:yes gene_type:complete
MTAFVTKNSARRYLQIAEALIEQVSDGTYGEGDKLEAERDLAAKHSVSRTTIREALLALEIMGYVEIQVGAGVFVLPRRNWKSGGATVGGDEIETGPHEILDLRRVLEARAAYLAAEHATPEQIEKLLESVNVMEKSIFRISAFNRADEAFHMSIAEMSNNTLLEEYIGDLWARRRGALWDSWYKPTQNAAYRRGTIEDHRLILSSIQTGQPLAAMTAMHVHIDKLVNRFLNLDMEPELARSTKDKSK